MANIGTDKEADANADNEQAIQDALKSIRFTDLPGNETTPGRAVPAPIPKLQPVLIAKTVPTAKLDAEIVPASIVMPHPSAIDDTSVASIHTEPPAVVPKPPPPIQQASPPATPTQSLVRIVEQTKLPERRNAPPSPPPTGGPLVRSSVPEIPKTPSTAQKFPELGNVIPKEQEVHIVTPEGSSAPVLSRPETHTPVTPQTLAESIVGELSPTAPTPAETPPVMGAVLNKPGLTPNEALPSESRPDKRPVVTSLHTLKDDLRDLVKVRKMSLIHAATLESERERQTADVESVVDATRARRRLRMFRLFAILALLFALGGAALFAVFIVQSERSGGQQTDLGSSLVFAEQTLSFPLLPDQNPREVRAQLATSRYQGNLTLGAMLRIVPTVSTAGGERPATTAEFLQAIAPTAPDELVRSVGTDFFFGTHTIDENVPVIIIPVASYEHAFAGMLAWEPSFNDDMTPLFPLVHYEKTDEQGIPHLVSFEDVLIKNYDVRALRDENGDIRMLYSFPSRDYLIISESPHSFVEALARLRAERRL
ncbi:hypothetical protein HY413_03520 [Candidatus Kaiserbacteria bacterium]|nr:hypothetical protein [Candidatus Kaiserbacteria bacterium]